MSTREPQMMPLTSALPMPGWQTDFHNSTAFEALVGGGGGAGKTWALVHAALLGVGVPKFFGVLFRHHFSDLFELMRATKAAYGPIGGRYDVAARRWTFPSGARIELAGLPDEKALLGWRGAELHYVGIDHVDEFEEPLYLGISTRCRPSHGVRARLRAARTDHNVMPTWIKARWAPWLGEGLLEPGRIIDRRTYFATGMQANPHLAEPVVGASEG